MKEKTKPTAATVGSRQVKGSFSLMWRAIHFLLPVSFVSINHSPHTVKGQLVLGVSGVLYGRFG